MTIIFEERDMSQAEYKREIEAFNEHSLEFGNPPDEQEQFGYVATDNGRYIGSSSGLAQKLSGSYGNYFYLSDLLVEKQHRKSGHGKKLLQLLEDKVKSLGIEYIWTWTAGEPGLEPGLMASKATVLPLDDSPMTRIVNKF